MPINAEQIGQLKDANPGFVQDLKEVSSVLDAYWSGLDLDIQLGKLEKTEENEASLRDLQDLKNIFTDLYETQKGMAGTYEFTGANIENLNTVVEKLNRIKIDGKPLFQSMSEHFENGLLSAMPTVMRDFKSSLANLNSTMQLGLENTELKKEIPGLESKLKEDGLEDLQRMFSTRTRRLYINSGEYNRAKMALDRYVEARKKGAVTDQMEKELRTAMTAYVDKVSKNGRKSISDMSHGYGAARLASGRGVLDFLDNEAKAKKENALNVNEEKEVSEEKNKEISYRELYNQHYGEILTEAGKDRRKRAADRALEQTKNGKAKQPPERESFVGL